MEGHFDVVVVGAGMAGLAAARAVERAGRSVAVLEARERAGGRLLTEELAEGAWVDHGGGWIGPGQSHVLGLAEELGVETFPTFDEGERVWFVRGERRTSKGDWPRGEPLGALDVAIAMRRFDRRSRRVPIDRPWAAPTASALDSRTIADWVNRNALTRTGKRSLSIMLRSLFAADPAETSLLFGLFSAASAGGLRTMLAIGGGAQDRRLVGGAQQLAERLARRLGDAVAYGAPVDRISWDGHGARATGPGADVSAARAIVTVPPGVVDLISFEPDLPDARREVHAGMPMGAVIKVHAVYEEPFWREDGLSGQAHDPEGFVSFTVDASPPSGSPGMLAGFIEADTARSASALSANERREHVVGCLERAFGPKAARPERYLELDWCSERWTGGCYGGNCVPGMLSTVGPALRAPVGPIHWAGTETATRWVGYIDGAIGSGERAAAEALGALR